METILDILNITRLVLCCLASVYGLVSAIRKDKQDKHIRYKNSKKK